MRVTEVDQKQEDKRCMTSPTSLDLRDESKVVFIIDEGRSDGEGLVSRQEITGKQKRVWGFSYTAESLETVTCAVALSMQPRPCYHVEPMTEEI